VSIRLLVRAGSIQDPPGKIGVAALAASLLDQGTTSKTAEEIADHIDFIGGALAAGSGSDLTFANVVVMKDSFGIGMDLLSDVIRNPAFDPAEIERQKQQTMSSLQVSANDPDYVASMLLERLVYGFHPYGLPNSGTPETLAAITRADLQAYHRRYFVPNNMILAIVGDVTNDEAFAAADRVFGSWPRADVPPVSVIEPPQPTRRIVIVDKPDAVQTEIRVGQIAIPRKHDDYMAWDLAVKILGGEGANRLHRVLRSERGLTYGAQADTQARKQAGHFAAETDTRTETTGEALRLMVDEFARLQRDRVGQAELLDAQAYLSGSFPLTIETPNDIAAQVLNVLFYELPVEEIGTFRERVQAVTPDAVQRVARAYVKPDRLSIVLVGDSASFVPQLKQAGFTDFEIIPITDLDLMSATLRRDAPRAPGQVAAVPSSSRLWGAARAAYTATPAAARQPPEALSDGPQAANDPAALALLQRIVEAKGGIEALRNLRTVTADSETTLHLEQGALVSKTRTYVSYPDKFRVDANVAGADVVQVYNGGRAWIRDPGGVHDAPPAMRDDFEASVRRDIIPLLLAAVDGRVRVRLGTEPAGGGVQSLQVGDTPESRVLLVVDSRGLVVKQTFSTAGPDGRPVDAEESFSDYRRINGVMVPYRADVSRGGRVVLSRMLTAVTLNSAIDDAMFARPQ
jgi:zinc protease